jgi:hypothetical protein
MTDECGPVMDDSDRVRMRQLLRQGQGLIDAQETVALSYSVPDNEPPASERKELRAENDVANCTSGQLKAFMKALYDNVMLKPEAIP